MGKAFRHVSTFGWWGLYRCVESLDHNKSVFVLGGYISPVTKWAAFIKEWDETLPFSGLKDEFGQPYFHMKEIARRSNCMEIVQAFYRVIEKHCELAVSVKINTIDLVVQSRHLMDGV